MRICSSIVIMMLLAVSIAVAADIKLEGISGDVVLVNGEMRQVGQTIDGVKIVSINGEEVTFEDQNGKTFTKSLKISFWDKMVSDVKNFVGQLKRKGPDVAKKSSAMGSSPESLTLNEKMKVADESLKELEVGCKEIMARLREKRPPSVKDVQRGSNKLGALMKANADRQNALKLPCPMSSKGAEAGSAYLAWAEGHRAREERIVSDINAKLQKSFEDAVRAERMK